MVDKETVELIQKIYQKYPTGGALHIVLDDGNIDDHDIQWCMNNLWDDEKKDSALFERCAKNLLSMPKNDRYQTIEAAWKGGLG